MRHKKFHDVEEAIQLMIDAPPLARVPSGRKENVYFVVDNSANVKRKETNQRARFWDDCGAYCTGSSQSHFYYMYDSNNRLKHVRYLKGVFCTHQGNEDGKRKFMPMKIQPCEGSLLHVIRKYDKLKKSHSYERRVTIIEAIPDRFV